MNREEINYVHVTEVSIVLNINFCLVVSNLTHSHQDHECLNSIIHNIQGDIVFANSNSKRKITFFKYKTFSDYFCKMQTYLNLAFTFTTNNRIWVHTNK